MHHRCRMPAPASPATTEATRAAAVAAALATTEAGRAFA